MHYRKKKSGCLFVALVAIVFVLAFKFGPSVMNYMTKKSLPSVCSVASVPSLTLITQNSDTVVSIDTGNMHSPCAILVRLSDKAVLMQKESDERIFPASLTKMMTAVVAVENIPDLQKKIELPSCIFQPLYKADASMAGFQRRPPINTRTALRLQVPYLKT